MKNIVHIVRTYGEKNQPYTTKLFSHLNNKGKYHHIIAAEKINKIFQNEIINISRKTFKDLFKINYFFLFSVFFFNKNFLLATKSLNFKQKIHFILKWEGLIKRRIFLIHLHHIQVFDMTILKFIKKRKIPIVVSFRGRDVIIDSLNEDTRKVLFEKLNYINHIHVISEYLKRFSQSINIKQPIDVVYRGMLIPSSIKNSINTKTNKVRIICVGRLAWEKGHLYLLDSIYSLKRKGYNIQLDIYGEGSLLELLTFRIHQLDLMNEVNLKGHIASSKLKDLYSNYNLAVQPSLYEALSNGLLELISYNIPCVISEVGGMVEIIENYVNGIYFNINEPNTLDQAIIDCLDIDLEKLLVFNKKIKKKFTLNNEVIGLENIYNLYL